MFLHKHKKECTIYLLYSLRRKFVGMQTILDCFYTPHVVATALLHYFASDKRTDLTQSKKTVLALHALASERRQVRITAGHISLSESLVLPVESVDDEAMQHLQELAAHLVDSTTFSVQVSVCCVCIVLFSNTVS